MNQLIRIINLGDKNGPPRNPPINGVLGIVEVVFLLPVQTGQARYDFCWLLFSCLPQRQSQTDLGLRP